MPVEFDYSDADPNKGTSGGASSKDSYRKNLAAGLGKQGGEESESGDYKADLPPISMKRGGNVRKTGIYKLHKGEKVVPAKSGHRKR